MKSILPLFLLFFILLNGIVAQNQVPNPSFEITSGCPTAQSQLSNAIGWNKPPGSGTTPDLFHSCHPGGATTCGNVDLPGGWAGTISANSGSAAAGVLTRYDFCGNCREYIQMQFSAPLAAGTTYDVEYYVICPPTCKYETNGLSAYIGGQISQPGNQPITGFVPQINSPLVTKAMGWTLVSGSYTAAGGESYITLGNYRNDAGTAFNTVTPSGSCALTNRGATYLFDDVSVAEQVLLDVNLLYFNASKMNETMAYLEWEISNPQDYEFITIQRSLDGVNYSTIADKLAPNVQEFIDLVPQEGANYYRLKFRALSGGVETTPIKNLTFDYNLGFTYHVFPNPFSNVFQLETFNKEVAQNVNVKLFDITGRVAYQTVVWMNEGRQLVTLEPSSELPSGTYIVQFETNGMVQQKKLIKR